MKLVSCGNVADWDEAKCCDDFSDFVIILDSLYLLCEWIHLVWLWFSSSGGGEFWLLLQSGLLFLLRPCDPCQVFAMWGLRILYITLLT
jgi:hypothetical protein